MTLSRLIDRIRLHHTPSQLLLFILLFSGCDISNNNLPIHTTPVPKATVVSSLKEKLTKEKLTDGQKTSAVENTSKHKTGDTEKQEKENQQLRKTRQSTLNELTKEIEGDTKPLDLRLDSLTLSRIQKACTENTSKCPSHNNHSVLPDLFSLKEENSQLNISGDLERDGEKELLDIKAIKGGEVSIEYKFKQFPASKNV